MDIQGLKDKILQLAIQGKLVEQNENDEPASALLQRIKEERGKLVKEKKIKKPKPLPEITDEEKPFEIPDSWEWVRLGEISNIRRGASPRPIKNYQTTDDEGINWIKIGDATGSSKYITFVNEKITQEGAKKSVYLEPGTLIMSNSMSFGKAYILKIDGCIHDGWLAFEFNEANIDVELLYIFLNASYERFDRLAVGTGVRNLNIDRVRATVIPLPPLSEQKRIVEKVDELFDVIDELDSNKEDLLEVINLTRNQVLQEAIQGKLVEQNPEDEPASLLLERIKEERDKLVKEGKIKKQKPLPEITEEEKPFELPESWEWVRLGNLIYNASGLSYKKEQLNIVSDKMVRVMRGGNILDMEYSYKPDDIFISSNIIKDELYLKEFDLITPAVSSLAHIGKIALINNDLDDVTVGGFVLILRNYYKNEKLVKYLFYYFNSNYYRNELRNITNKSGQAFYNVSRVKMANLLIALPPLAEQKRIVEKVDMIMNMLDELEKTIME